MEHAKNNTLVIGLLTLIVGLLLGYFFGASRLGYKDTMASMPMGMHGAMDDMMMGLEGKTGDALDLAFLDEMIVHHEGGVAMAQTLLRGTKRPELIKLGTDIVTAQNSEINKMKEWRRVWFNK